MLRDYEELLIQNVLAQLKVSLLGRLYTLKVGVLNVFLFCLQNLSQLPISQALVVYQPLLSILYTFFNANILGKTLSMMCIKNLMSALLHLLADQKLTNGDDSQYNKVINGICLKVLDKVNFTNIYW